MGKYIAVVAAMAAVVNAAAEPSFSFVSSGTYLPRSRKVELPFVSAQVTNAEVSIYKCYVNNLNAYDLDSSAMKSRMTRVGSKRVEFAPPYDGKSGRMLDLSGVAGELSPGFYLVKVDTGLSILHKHTYWSYREKVQGERLFALTDIGLAADVADGRSAPKAVVKAHSLASGAPLAGVEVHVMSRSNQMVGRGTTDSTGVAKIPLTAAFHSDDDEVRGVIATKGEDMSYLKLNWESSVAGADRGMQDELNEPRAFLFAERDICRPGESFDTGLFLRSSPHGGMSAIGEAPVELELGDPDDTVVETRRLVTDRWGFASASWQIPAAAKVGTWSVAAKLDGRSLGKFDVNVSMYVPDRFRVELAIKPSASADELAQVDGAAVYYFGEKVRESKWKVEHSAVVAEPLPEWKKGGWSVGTGEIPEVPSVSDELVVEDGEVSVGYGDERFLKLRESKSPVMEVVEASVTPPGARTVTARAFSRYNPTDSYIGVRDSEAGGKVGARAFEFAFLPAGGGEAQPADARRICVCFERREWKCHAVQGGDDRWRMEWREERTECPELARTVGVGRVVWPMVPSGAYTVVAKADGGQETHHDFWHCAGDVSSRSASPASLYIRSDVEKAAPGSRVRLRFNAAREGRAYVAAGERGIEYTADFEVKKGENAFVVPIRSDAASGATVVSVTVVNRDSPDAPRLSGEARIPVDHSARRYPVSLSIPATARPGATVPVTVTADGPGAVRIMAVDEGVLALTCYEVEDPFAYFYDHDFGRPFGTYDMYSMIYPDLKILPNGRFGGGGIGNIMKRRNVRTRRDSTLRQKETARVVMPLVEIPQSGSTTVQMRMPDFTGAMRVDAVAVDDSRAGSAKGEVVVRDAASLFLNAPRFAVGGDSFELVAEVFNHDLPGGPWSLEVEGRRYSGMIAKGGSTNVSFRVSLPEGIDGERKFAGALRIGGETFRDEATLVVRPKSPSVVEVAYSVRAAGEKAPPSQPAGDAWLRLDEEKVVESGTPREAVADALGWLGKYPYGCLEQTVAAAFPFLAAADLERIGAIDAKARADAGRKVKAAYGEIMQMARSDGSFSMWPGGDETWFDGTLFALHFVFAAERQGLVKPDPRERMVNWLRRAADGNSAETRFSRAYAAYVLALAGEESFANAARNVLATDGVDFASFLASAALVRGGRAADGANAYCKAVEARVWETSPLPNGVCWSRVRAIGMALAIAGGDASEAMAPAVVKLIDALHGDGSAWGTTRDNAWACAGLAKFAAPDLVFLRRIRVGIPRTPPASPAAIKVERPFPEKAKKGDLVKVEVSVESPREVESAVLCALVPGGFEIEDGSLATRSGGSGDGDSGRGEVRDDRWLWFGSLPKTEPGKPMKLRFSLRAVTRGTFAVPALTVEDMYDPDFAGRVDADGAVTVE